MRQWLLASLVLATAVVGLTAARQAPGSQGPGMRARPRHVSPHHVAARPHRPRHQSPHRRADARCRQASRSRRVEFFVDGVKVGTVESGPPYAVDWVDENPFERARDRRPGHRFGRPHAARTRSCCRPIEVVEKTGVTGVLLETSVYDKAGRFVSALDPGAFTVTEDGIEQTIDLVTRETHSERSSSARGQQPEHVAPHGLRAPRHRADRRQPPQEGPRHRRALQRAHRHDHRVRPTMRQRLRQAITAMRAGGGTALLDGLIEATRLLEHAEGRRAIVLMTDGYDENSIATQDDVLKRDRRDAGHRVRGRHRRRRRHLAEGRDDAEEDRRDSPAAACSSRRAKRNSSWPPTRLRPTRTAGT